jgi:thymidylate kinase
MTDKTYLLKVDDDVVRVRASKRPDKDTIEALSKMVRIVKSKYLNNDIQSN